MSSESTVEKVKLMQDQLPLKDSVRSEFRFKALRATQPIGDLYIAAMPAQELGQIAQFDVRRILQEDRDVERYLGIQRPLNPHRVQELEKYVNYQDATFPTGILVAIDENYAEYDENTQTLIVRNYKIDEDKPSITMSQIAKVIDGQHRIAGLYNFKGKSFDVPVTVFIGSDISDQAYVFATVNLEQTKVSKSLAYDLFALARTRSPQRTCHNVAVALDSDERSPLYKRIKRLGVATPGRSAETITQATFVESLMAYISKDPKLDRDALLKGSTLQKADAQTSNQLIFRNMFIDARDVEIAAIILNYFNAVRERWPEGWNSKEKGYILNKTNGFRALMRILRPLYLRLGTPGDVISAERFYQELLRVPVSDRHFSTENYAPGSSGESALRNDLATWLELDRSRSTQ